MSGHQAVAIENAALRLQLAAFQRKRKRPVLTKLDRLFWIALRRLWSDWQRPLLMSRLTLSRGGNANDFGDSGRGYRKRIAVGEPARYGSRDSPLDRTNGFRQSAMACAADSW